MLIGFATPQTEAGTPPDEAALVAMSKYNEELQKAGVLLDLGGLTPTSRGARVVYSGKQARVIDGPFVESKELIAGYLILEVKNLAEAIEWAKRAPFGVGSPDAMVELRPLYGAEDFDTAEERAARKS
ncbi:MAG TPA: YciI family protein [Kofleriaceae bacterium]